MAKRRKGGDDPADYPLRIRSYRGEDGYATTDDTFRTTPRLAMERLSICASDDALCLAAKIDACVERVKIEADVFIAHRSCYQWGVRPTDLFPVKIEDFLKTPEDRDDSLFPGPEDLEFFIDGKFLPVESLSYILEARKGRFLGVVALRDLDLFPYGPDEEEDVTPEMLQGLAASTADGRVPDWIEPASARLQALWLKQHTQSKERQSGRQESTEPKDG